MRAHKHIRFGLVVLLAALSGTVAFAPGAASAAEWESPTYNVLVVIPESPAAWHWLPTGQDWDKFDIVKGATRIVETLKNGKKANGEHGLMHLIVRDAKEGESLASITDSTDTLDTLMKRFGANADWPAVEKIETSLPGDVPAMVFGAKGKALNSRNGQESRCEGRMLVTTALGKVYFLRMYAWHTEYDDEGLTIDLDMIEGEFALLKTKGEDAPPERPEEGPEPGGDADVDEPAPEDDEGKAEEILLREYGIRLVKHKKLTRAEPDQEDMILKLEGSDAHGYYGFYLYAVNNSRIVNGQQAPPEDIKKWITTDWWKNFLPNHPDGDINTFKFPKKPFLTMPEFEDPIHIAGGKKKTPIDPSSSDLMKKMKAVEKSKAKQMGKEKVIEPYRGVLQGNRPRRGQETIVRFAWRSAFHSFRFLVSIGGEGNVKYGEALKATLESMEHYEE